ncbi:MAG: methyltransferase domain-containing protein [Clostridia bacterium]|nr:methyltransferase domain-containing protein [Clostridia bacterium]
MYICPICKEQLIRENKSYYCKNRHCYDISKEGYVNLLPVQKKNSLSPGDNKEMIMARHNYLNEGAYDTLVKSIALEIRKAIDTTSLNILDAGCGEGYYLKKIKEYLLEEDKDYSIGLYGVDISKDAVKIGAKSYKDIEFSVGSVFDMPYAEKAFDVVLNVFAPFDNKEIVRVLKNGGLLIKVVPSKTHLHEFRKIIYETVTEHEEKSIDVTGFDLVSKVNVNYSKYFDKNETIASLYKMTPYYFNSSEESKEKILSLQEITLTIDFDIYVYRLS